MGVTSNMANWLRRRVASDKSMDSVSEMNAILRKASQWRSLVLANTFLRHHGNKILQGPFAGMNYVSVASEGALIPRLLGTYESELHPYLDELFKSELDCVIDIGCAEGYYAVGIARSLSDVIVYAFDIDENARKSCSKLAAENGVADRLVVGGEFKPEGFEDFSGKRCLVLVDVEGAECDILQPSRSPELKNMSLIVETHDQFRPGTLRELTSRFEGTHRIVKVEQKWPTYALPSWLEELGHLDRLLAVWEWRTAPTPWLVMTPLDPAGAKFAHARVDHRNSE